MKKNVLETMFIDNLFEKNNKKPKLYTIYHTYYYYIVNIGKRNSAV